MKITRKIKLCYLAVMLSVLLCLSASIYSQEYPPVEFFGSVGLNDLLTSHSLQFLPDPCSDMVFQEKQNRIYMLSKKNSRFGVSCLNFDPSNGVVSFHSFTDLCEKKPQCNYLFGDYGIIIDPSENFLCVLYSGCTWDTIPSDVSSDFWILDISKGAFSPSIAGYENLMLLDDDVVPPVGMWGMAVTNMAERIFLSTGPPVNDGMEGFFLTYTYNNKQGLNLIEKRGYFEFSEPELGFLMLSPDDKHLYSERWDFNDISQTSGAIFELQTYTTPSLVMEDRGIPAFHAQFDNSGRHLYRYQESGGQIHHWMRNDNPSSETFGYLDLVGDYKDPFKLPRYDTSFILSQDQTYGCSYTWDKNENKTSVTVFNRNTQTGVLEPVMGNHFPMGRPFQFVCSPRDNRIHILFYDSVEKSYEIYEFRYDQDPMALGIARAITGKTEASDFYDYNQDGEVSVADIISRLIQTGN